MPQKRQIPRTDDGSLVPCWLLAKSPPGTPAPTDYWLSTRTDNTRCRRWSGWPSCAGLKHGRGADAQPPSGRPGRHRRLVEIIHTFDRGKIGGVLASMLLILAAYPTRHIPTEGPVVMVDPAG